MYISTRKASINMEEIWKDIKGHEGVYQVSNFGRVRSLDMVVNYFAFGKQCSRTGKGRILKPAISGQYLAVALNRGNTQTIHRLVAEAFLPNPENKEQVNHKDGNKLNNTLYNLEWATRRENASHAVKTGLTAKGTRARSAKLTDKEAAEIFKDSGPQKDIAKKYNVSVPTVSMIRSRKIWTHITNPL